MSHYKRGRPKAAARACSCGNKGLKRDGNHKAFEDVRHEPACDVVRDWPAKKNTKRWCGGHVGREHQAHWQPDRLGDWAGRLYMEQVCAVCKKKMDTCWPPYSPRYIKDWVCKCGHHEKEAVCR